MRIGLLADIHEDVDRLAEAIARCRREGVDRLITLGDLYLDGRRFAETVRTLDESDVTGVWGNHEFGICHEPVDWVGSMFDAPTRAYMARLRPRIEIDGILMGHVLPRHDPTDFAQPWYIDRAPETAEEAAPDFAAFAHRRMFLGHYHRWLIATPDGAGPWSADHPFTFDRARRYLVVVAAVCDGSCAIYDTVADVLTPLRIELA